jgi:hypothetical protein
MFQFSNLVPFREQKLVSRTELSRLTGLSALTIAKLEAGRCCRPDTAKKVVASFGIILDAQNLDFNGKADSKIVYKSPYVDPASKQLILVRVSEAEARTLGKKAASPKSRGQSKARTKAPKAPEKGKDIGAPRPLAAKKKDEPAAPKIAARLPRAPKPMARLAP